MFGLSDIKIKSMHSVALEKAFPMMCLDLNSETAQNPPNLAKPKPIAFGFFLKMSCFYK